MFSRRHPYLYFILSFSAINAVTILIISLIFSISAQRFSLNNLPISGEKVGVIEIAGTISDARNVIRHLKKFREDDDIKAIVLRVESPGGGVGPSQEIFREIEKTVKDKTIITSMGAVAASGGYYVAAGTSGIVANPGTITGSIGVIISYTNFEEIINKIGLTPVVIKSGEYKDTGSPVRKMEAKERELLQNLIDQTHQQFVTAISTGRKMDRAKVEAIADGRIFTGEEAKKLGLVDRLGNIEDAIEWAGREGGIKGEISVVYPRKEKPSIFEYLIDSAVSEIMSRITDSW